MRHALPFAVALLAAAPAHAQVFKCVTPSGAVEYQSYPCTPAAHEKEVEIRNTAPTEEDALRAQKRAIRDGAAARRIDRERESRQRQADLQRTLSDIDKNAQTDRCARYKTRSAMLEGRAETWQTKKYRDMDLAEAKALKDQHFSECFGK